MESRRGTQVTRLEAPITVEVLAAWQAEARQLLDRLRPRPHPEGVLPTSELHERASAIRQFRWTVLPRESRKQRFLWPALREHLRTEQAPNGGSAPGSARGSARGSPVDELAAAKRSFEQELVRLRWSDQRAEHFDRQLQVFIDATLRYLDREQRLLRRIATELPGSVSQRVDSRLREPRGVFPMRGLQRLQRLQPVQAHPDMPSQHGPSPCGHRLRRCSTGCATGSRPRPADGRCEHLARRADRYP